MTGTTLLLLLWLAPGLVLVLVAVYSAHKDGVVYLGESVGLLIMAALPVGNWVALIYLVIESLRGIILWRRKPY